MIGPLGRSFRDLHGDLVARSQLRRLIRDRGVELVHAHLSEAELLAAACVPRSTLIVASRLGRTMRYEDVPWYRASEAFAHLAEVLAVTAASGIHALVRRLPSSAVGDAGSPAS